MTDYNSMGTAFVLISGILGIICIAVLVGGVASAKKDATSDIEKIQ